MPINHIWEYETLEVWLCDQIHTLATCFWCNVTLIKPRWIELRWTHRQTEGESKWEEQRSIQHTDRESSRENVALSKLSAPCGVNESALSLPLWECVFVCSCTLKQANLFETKAREHSLTPNVRHQMLRQQAATWFPLQKHWSTVQEISHSQKN